MSTQSMENELKQRILDKAKEKFLRYGYRGVRTDEIAKELGISKRTLYEKIKNKKDMILEVLSNEDDKLIQNMSEIFNKISENDDIKVGWGFEEIYKIILEHIRFFNADVINDLKMNIPELCNRNKGSFFHHLEEKLTKFFEFSKSRDIIRKSVKAKFVLYMMNNVVETLMIDLRDNSNSLSLNESMNEIMDIILFGIIDDKNRDLFRKHVNI